MNPSLQQLQPYAFERLNALLRGVTPNPAYSPIKLYIGEPKHPTPSFIREALTAALDGLARYPTTLGEPSLRQAIAAWMAKRYGLADIDPATQIIPVNGSREALFGLAQAVIERTRPDPVVVMPNPFYQIYEGAALLAGARPEFLNTTAESRYALNLGQLADSTWERAQLVYVCSPGNPTGAVMTLDDWRVLFELSDRYGFVIASDECYSEIYFDEGAAPLGGMQAAAQLGRAGFPRLVMLSSLSKRSNAPGLRSGFVAGDAAILKPYLLYRTYQGGAMPPANFAASLAAWQDEAHVADNRRLYRDKFDAALEIFAGAVPAERPQAAFYLWLRTPIADTAFARRLHAEYNVSVLPGSFLARNARGINPGEQYVRIALVASTQECIEAARRIRAFYEGL
ncbi:MAG: succinyldiaminopimelate transaminase [Burkholderiales bacterium]|nr:succinyldiaminopimelate transaminase [Burkholderiales bacterium]